MGSSASKKEKITPGHRPNAINLDIMCRQNASFVAAAQVDTIMLLRSRTLPIRLKSVIERPARMVESRRKNILGYFISELNEHFQHLKSLRQ